MTFKINMLNLGSVAVDAYTRTRGGGDDGDDAREHAGRAVARALAHQLHAAGAPNAPPEEQLHAMLASHLALQRAGEEMPSVAEVAVLLRAFEPRHGIPERPIAKIGDRILALFAPHFARLTQGRDNAERAALNEAAERHAIAQERDEARETLVAVQNDRANYKRALADSERENATLRARIAELEDEARAAALTHHDGMVKDQNRIRALESRVTELESRPEPGADLVDRFVPKDSDIVRTCGLSIWQAQKVADLMVERIRTVFSHLAAREEEAWPTPEDLCRVAWSVEAPALGIVERWDDINQRIRDAGLLGSAAVLALLHSRLSPVLGALRATIAEQGRRIADLEEHTIRRVKEEREACCDIARSIYHGNTEIPRKDAAAWYACAEFITGEIARRA